MYRIVKKQELTTNIYLMDVEAKRVAKSCQPGQFVIVRMDAEGERIPLTICDYDREKGTVTIVFQSVGAETHRMVSLEEGDSFHDFVGPLGCPSELVKETPEELKKKRILFVAGGVGAAPVYPQVKWLHEQGVAADVIVGSKTRDLLILEKEMEAVAGNLYITTDHDEVRLPADERAEEPYRGQPESHHGGRHGDVRGLPCDRRRKSEVRLRGRAGIRRACSELR